VFRRFKTDYLVLGTILTLSLVSTALAADQQAKPQQITGLDQPITSPDGRFQLLWKRNEKVELHEIWLRSSRTPDEQALLYSFGRSADVLWSPDSTMVAITDAATSDQAFVTVFRITGPKAFEEIKEIGRFIEEKYFKRKDGSYIFDHTYALVAGWSKDSKSLQVELKAHGAMDGSNLSLQKKVTVRIPKKK
jgi:hypothetical protein